MDDSSTTPTLRDLPLLQEEGPLEIAVQPASLVRFAAWSLVEEATSGKITLRLPRHFSSQHAVEMTSAVSERLLRHGGPVIFVADLLDVVSFDPATPMMVVCATRGVVSLIERADIIVRNPVTRAAAVAIARVLDVPFTVRSER
jgi:hypothetical protein